MRYSRGHDRKRKIVVGTMVMMAMMVMMVMMVSFITQSQSQAEAKEKAEAEAEAEVEVEVEAEAEAEAGPKAGSSGNRIRILPQWRRLVQMLFFFINLATIS